MSPKRTRLNECPPEISIGAMVVIDAVVRLLPGALGAEDGAVDETFTDGLIEYPQYTRPRDFRGMGVPDILLSGNHQLIRRWREGIADSRQLWRAIQAQGYAHSALTVCRFITCLRRAAEVGQSSEAHTSPYTRRQGPSARAVSCTWVRPDATRSSAAWTPRSPKPIT